ncbi:MAG TPA: hypothetical protein VN838_30060 [Bradyrhizobium sp.]|nr:hypothetical protein [Bradyrhizobium sp.]
MRADSRLSRNPREDEDEFGQMDFDSFDHESILPYVPDTDEWHYCWMRAVVNGEPDKKNINKYLNGKVRWEAVSPDELNGLVSYRATNANVSNSGVIQIDDVVLMRCSKRIHEVRANHYDKLTSLKTATVRNDTKEFFKQDRRVSLRDWSDEERTGLRDASAGGDE